MKRFILLAAALLTGLSAAAKVELTPLFTDNMVFQQNVQAPVWGKATPGATVKVTTSLARAWLTQLTLPCSTDSHTML